MCCWNKLEFFLFLLQRVVPVAGQSRLTASLNKPLDAVYFYFQDQNCNVAHHEAAKEAAGSLPDAKEERAHETHHAEDSGWGWDLGNISHSWRHHEHHGQAFKCLEGEDVGGVGDERVAQHPASLCVQHVVKIKAIIDWHW